MVSHNVYVKSMIKSVIVWEGFLCDCEQERRKVMRVSNSEAMAFEHVKL